MKVRVFSLLFLLLAAPTQAQSKKPRQKVTAAYANLPLIFEPNQCQTNPQVNFLPRGLRLYSVGGLYLGARTDSTWALRPGAESLEPDMVFVRNACLDLMR